MARYPKIDQPCPLDIDAQRSVRGHCGACGKTVRCLDGESDTQRAQILAQAKGSLCVSYRVAATMSAALALSVSGQVSAGQHSASAQSPLPTANQPLSSETLVLVPVQFAKTPQADTLEPLELIFVGGVSKPGEADWVDESDLQELPLRSAVASDFD